ncbi:hypothetical protein PIB30_030894 [Stylosanthes scabra]|uniref:Pentatricopeptide repeat-containing protein n=1 Tax=Stylosanthes scabra TaxID=79078 RepID=A0ABU6YCB4_9FABA|nr:hypothetical protein [Stylosanthes scabra]
MNMFVKKWNLLSTRCWMVQRTVVHYSHQAPRDILLHRILRPAQPNITMNTILNQWLQDGGRVKHSCLRYLIRRLMILHRSNHALQVVPTSLEDLDHFMSTTLELTFISHPKNIISLEFASEVSKWMSNEYKRNLKSEDICIHLNLISKVHGLDPAEKYFNSISDSVKDFKVYSALLDCYLQHNSMEKVEAILQKLKEQAGFYHESDRTRDRFLVFRSNRPVRFDFQNTVKEYDRVKAMDWETYGVLLKHYAQVSDYEKLYSLMREIIDEGLYCSVLTNIRLHSCVTIKDIDWLESLLLMMESDPKASIDWITYILAAKSYIQAGQHEKAFEMLEKSEHEIEAESAYKSLLTESYIQAGQHKTTFEIMLWNSDKNKAQRKNSAFKSLLTACASIGKRDNVYRIWDMWKRLDIPYNTSYIYMVNALARLNDVDGTERIFKECESEANVFRILNVMVITYCKNGLVEKAEAFLERLSKSGNEVKASIWDRLAYGYYKINDMDNAIRTMNKVILAG